ncbi:hypothetical protein Taro_013122 [Colocasia esculenta]|uniref:Pentatricopeptide repeat-containing protein n=1 Tax=Colocasia esculenta TaxID=4460 RepID=A0A843UF09_COLES|nr:hypothetical protein [Colocasia esculenta]
MALFTFCCLRAPVPTKRSHARSEAGLDSTINAHKVFGDGTGHMKAWARTHQKKRWDTWMGLHCGVCSSHDHGRRRQLWPTQSEGRRTSKLPQILLPKSLHRKCKSQSSISLQGFICLSYPTSLHQLMKAQLPRFCRHSINPDAAPARLYPGSPPPHLLETQEAQAPVHASGVLAGEAQAAEGYRGLDAHQLFEETSTWDVVTATAVLSSLARQCRYRDAVRLFTRLFPLHHRPNQFTFGTTIHAATALRDTLAGRQLHALAVKTGFQSDVFVGSALVDHYAKLGPIGEAGAAFADVRAPNVVSYTTLASGFLKHGRVDDALRLFREMPARNVVSWNAMIGGCSQIGLNEVAINLFVEMCREGAWPNQSTFPCVLTAAANMAALGTGKSIHASGIKHLGKFDIYVGNSLVSFYSKCGSLEESILVFDRLRERNIVSWNAVICGYAQNGQGREALRFYARMRAAGGPKPNDVTLLGLLSACNHAGMVEEGHACFRQARAEDPEMLRPEHYACVVDLLARFGRLAEAQRFLSELPFEPGLGFWKAMLGGCQVHANKAWSEAVARRIQEMDPGDVSSYVLLSNVYSAAGRWRRASVVRREMKERGMRRVPGCSWIEVRNRVHVFLNGDRTHAQADEIYGVLDACLRADELTRTQ